MWLLSYCKAPGGRIVLSYCKEPIEGSYFCEEMLSALLVSMSGPSKQKLPHVRVWNLHYSITLRY